MSRYMVLCATVRDRRELGRLNRDGDVFEFHEYGTAALESLVSGDPAMIPIADPESEIDRILQRCNRFRPDGVISTDDYPGSILASIVAEQLGLPCIPAATSLLCQHKYHSRWAQRLAVGEATPAFELIDANATATDVDFPLFVKPVKSFFSVGAKRVDALAALSGALKAAVLPRAFFAPFERLLRKYSHLDMAGHVLVESALAGDQCTVEGYASQGHVRILGVVDSVMYPGTASFLRFDYPSRLPAASQSCLGDIATRAIAALDYGDGLFNIEMMYDRDRERASIIEINPRMSSQFADLFEKVDGTNTYSILLDLATGRRPSPLWRQGGFARASSLALRSFENLRTIRVPTSEDIADTEARHPEARIELLTRSGRTLAQELQDGHSYRFALINAGGRDDGDLERRLHDCIRRLPFRFARVPGRRADVAQQSTPPIARQPVKPAADRYPAADADAP